MAQITAFSDRDITTRVDPATKSIAGVVTITARIVSPIETFLLDLDTPYTVSAVAQVGPGNATSPLRFDRPVTLKQVRAALASEIPEDISDL